MRRAFFKVCPIYRASEKDLRKQRFFGKRRSRRARRAFCDKQNADKQRRATTSAAEENLRCPDQREGSGVVLNSQDFAAVSSARNPRAFIISARFKAAPFINDCACQNHIFGKAHSICRKLTALSERVNAAHFLTSEAPKMRRREKTCRRAAGERRVFFQTHGKKFCLVQNFFREVRR